MSVLAIKNLTKDYGNHQGVFGFDLTVEAGDIVLLLGPNGAGKTTTFKGILGLTDAQHDQLQIMGESFNRKKSLKNVGAMISKPVFYDYLTGMEHLGLSKYVYNHVDDYRVDETLSTVGLNEAKYKKVGKYSTGMKQRLDLARAIIHKPMLLLLDEPFSGMDIEAKHEFKNMLKKIQEDTGILISSHMVGDLEHFANKLVIIYDGISLYSGEMSFVEESGLTLEEFYLSCIDRYKKGA